MKAFKITTTNSDYPYLVVAEGVKEAVTKLEEKLADRPNYRFTDIANIQKLEYDSDNIVF